MGNLVNSLKKFIANKNTFTILLVLAGVVVLWGFYSWRVNQAVDKVKVPYAINAIEAATQIKKEDVGYIEINKEILKKANILQNLKDIQDKYVTVGTSIPKGGLFYADQVVEKSELPNTILEYVKEGETLYSLGVNNHTTFGNSIYPGDTIDLFMKATDDTGKLIFGKFIENIEVLAVRDSAGKDVFSATVIRTPAELLFGVKDDLYELLKKSDYISGVSLVVVPRNQKTVIDGELHTQEYLKNFILAKTAVIE